MKNYEYERVAEDGSIESCPQNDLDGKVTGRIVFNVGAWFDEHPEERIARGWIKHLKSDPPEEFNEQTQFLTRSTRMVDEHTIEDVYHVIDKSEEMMLYEEVLHTMGIDAGYMQVGDITFFGR